VAINTGAIQEFCEDIMFLDYRGKESDYMNPYGILVQFPQIM